MATVATSVTRRHAAKLPAQRKGIARKLPSGDFASLCCPPSISPHRLDRSGCFFGEFPKLGQAFWKKPRELAIDSKQRVILSVTTEKVIAVHPFALERRADQ